MEIRKLTIDDRSNLENLINTIETNLEQKAFWLPIDAESREHFFDPNWTDFYGIFDNSKLIAASALFYNEHEFKESAESLGMENTSIAEIGRCMVHLDFRGENLLYKINCELLKVAAEKRIECILATIHPDNLPSQKSFQRLGLKKELTYIKSNGYVRDIYMMEMWSMDWLRAIEFSSKPNDNKLVPYPLQFANCKRLEECGNAVYIFDEVGAGKTINAGLMALHYLYNHPDRDVLIVTELSLVRASAAYPRGEFLGKLMKLLPFERLGMDKRIQVYGNNYQRIDKAKAAQRNYGMIIIDEAHIFLTGRNKNGIFTPKRYESLLRLTESQKNPADRVVFLTATPLRYGINDSNESKHDFHVYHEIVRMLTKSSQKSSVLDSLLNINEESNSDRGNTGLNLTQVLDVKNPVTRYFKETVETAVNEPMKEPGGNVSAEKIVGHERIVECKWYSQNREKADALVDEITNRIQKELTTSKEQQKNRFIVFTRFIEFEVDKIVKAFQEFEKVKWEKWNPTDLQSNEKHTYYVVTGENSNDLGLVQGKMDNLPTVLILSCQVGQQGVDLPGYNHVVNYHIPSIPADIEQRFGRVDRLGKGSPKIYLWFLLREKEPNSKKIDFGYEGVLKGSYSWNFKCAVTTYLDQFISTIPAKNTFLTNEILDQFLNQESIKHALDELNFEEFFRQADWFARLREVLTQLQVEQEKELELHNVPEMLVLLLDDLSRTEPDLFEKNINLNCTPNEAKNFLEEYVQKWILQLEKNPELPVSFYKAVFEQEGIGRCAFYLDKSKINNIRSSIANENDYAKIVKESINNRSLVSVDPVECGNEIMNCSADSDYARIFNLLVKTKTMSLGETEGELFDNCLKETFKNIENIDWFYDYLSYWKSGNSHTSKSALLHQKSALPREFMENDFHKLRGTAIAENFIWLICHSPFFKMLQEFVEQVRVCKKAFESTESRKEFGKKILNCVGENNETLRDISNICNWDAETFWNQPLCELVCKVCDEDFEQLVTLRESSEYIVQEINRIITTGDSDEMALLAGLEISRFKVHIECTTSFCKLIDRITVDGFPKEKLKSNMPRAWHSKHFEELYEQVEKLNRKLGEYDCLDKFTQNQISLRKLAYLEKYGKIISEAYESVSLSNDRTFDALLKDIRFHNVHTGKMNTILCKKVWNIFEDIEIPKEAREGLKEEPELLLSLPFFRMIYKFREEVRALSGKDTISEPNNNPLGKVIDAAVSSAIDGDPNAMCPVLGQLYELKQKFQNDPNHQTVYGTNVEHVHSAQWHKGECFMISGGMKPCASSWYKLLAWALWDGEEIEQKSDRLHRLIFTASKSYRAYVNKTYSDIYTVDMPNSFYLPQKNWSIDPDCWTKRILKTIDDQ